MTWHARPPTPPARRFTHGSDRFSSMLELIVPLVLHRSSGNDNRNMKLPGVKVKRRKQIVIHFSAVYEEW